MNIAIINHEDPWMVLASTSLITRIKKDYPKSNIYFFSNQESVPFLLFNNQVTVSNGYVCDFDCEFDYAFNLSPKIESCNLLLNLKAKVKMGFTENLGKIDFANKEAEYFYRVLNKEKKTDKNIFQLMYKACGMTWKGEGYNLCYYPRNKTNKNITGVITEKEDLKNFLISNLSLKESKLCSMPFRSNILKKIDEVNRCMNVVTDDLFILHASIALRKNVQFLDLDGLCFNTEFFGRGSYYRVLDAYSKF